MSDIPRYPTKLQDSRRDGSGYVSDVQQLTDGDLEHGVIAGRDDDEVTFGIQ